MPKVKVKRKGVALDMTAMCDVAFLLLTFFILTTKFKPNEPLTVDTPTSISTTKVPESDIMLISIGNDGRIFFGIDGQYDRITMLDRIAKEKGITFSDKQKKAFSLMDSFGCPINQLPGFLNLDGPDMQRFEQKGIPCDSLTNELYTWVLNARYTNPKIRIAIKGDRKADYKIVKNIIATLQDQNINRFNLVTGMEGRPTVEAPTAPI
ncbi:MAG: biopolymer transporter ExbD [Bacteroidota bacterium]|nr:biopolymer transporter ExbD [Bacteroidota bacterium]